MLPELKELLTLAGFTLQSHRRATCGWCNGHDKATASYTDGYVHCFRCGTTKGYVVLARELGFLKANLSDTDRAKLATIQEKEKRRIAFLEWQNSKLGILIMKIRPLNYRANLARKVLLVWPEEELAWQALADLYHNEARIFAAMDLFSMEPVSRWIESEITAGELIELWRNEQAGRNRQGA
jgi:hypothetical protein